MSFRSLLAMADGAALQHLGGPVTYETSVGEVIELRGVFDAVYVALDAGMAGAASSGPAVFLLVSDLVAPGQGPIDLDEDAVGARVVHSGVRYRVRSVQKDGLGGARLLLHEEG